MQTHQISIPKMEHQQPVSFDYLRAHLTMRRYSAKFKAGNQESLSIMNFNSYYRFYDVWRHDHRDDITSRIEDPTTLVISLDLCRVHGLYFGTLKKNKLLELLMSHWCSAQCQDTLYIFKGLPSPRKNISAQFKCDGKERLSSNLALMTISGLSVDDGPHNIDGIGAEDENNRSQYNLGPDNDIENGENINEINAIEENTRSQEINSASPHSDEYKDTHDHLEPCNNTRKASIIREWQMETSTSALEFHVCSACSVKVNVEESEWVHCTTIELSLLRNDLLHERVMPTDYDYKLYDGALLDPRGLEFTDKLGFMRVCSRCLNSLHKSVMPKYALSNWLYYGRDSLPDDVKTAFKCATMFEKMLTCRARCNSVCCKFSPGDETSQGSSILASARKGMRGNIMVAPLDVIRMNEVLPPPSDAIRDTMCAVFVSDTMPRLETIQRLGPILVRKSRVKDMINFLLQNNSHYQPTHNFGFSENNLESLFEFQKDNGVPASVHIGHIPRNDAINAATSDYTPRNIDAVLSQYDDSDELLMETVGYSDGDDSPIKYHAMKEIALRRCLEGKPFVVSGSGSQAIPDFNNTSIMTWLFPHLDPWGIGGFHHPGRTIRLTMQEQVSHLLRISDSPFERDPEFAFVFFNILRKSMVSRSLRFTVPQKTHRAIVRDLMSINPEVLIELNRLCRDNPRFQPKSDDQKKAFSLLRSLRLVSKHIPGSDGYKLMLRNQIRGIINHRGTPTLFITINPSDVDNPIVRLCAGDKINLETLSHGESLTSWQRKLLAARNPAACAIFFDLMITKFIKIILRHGRTDDPGIYGTCEAYFATVEAQGKGTLHCHMLVWLKGHLSPQLLRDTMLASDDYKNRVFRWLESAIMCEFPDMDKNPRIQLDRSQRILHAKEDPHPATVPPPLIPQDDSNLEEFWREYNEHLSQLLYEYNWHVHQATCWKYLKRGQAKCDENCRMGMDGQTRLDTTMDPDTFSVMLRRLHPKIASYTDLVTFLLRCNMDVKFVGSGDAAKSFLYYVTDYITKSSLSVHVGMTALSYAVKKAYNKYPNLITQGSDLQTSGAVVTAVNAMMGRHEISHPQVMSYLIGGGDHYTSEKFSVLHWGAIVQHVDAVWSAIDGQSSDEVEPIVNITSNEHTPITGSNQQLDYTFRSSHEYFELLGLYDFVAWTSKSVYSKDDKKRQNRKGTFDGEGHPQQDTHYLVVRKTEHVPVILGPSFSNPSTSEDAKDRWARDILILFKPWRSARDLKRPDQSWLEAFYDYNKNFSQRTSKIIKNMTVLTECSDAKSIRPGSSRNADSTNSVTEDDPLNDEEALYPQDLDPYAFGSFTVTEDYGGEDQTTDQRDELLAALIGPETSRLLDMCLPHHSSHIEENSLRASTLKESDYAEIGERIDFMKQKRKRRRVETEEEENDDRVSKRARRSNMRNELPFTERAVLSDTASGLGLSFLEYANRAKGSVIDHMNLRGNQEQLRAFEHIADHLIQGNTEQLLMYVSGVGGTGKSHVIKSVISLFDCLDKRNELLLGAPTGIAAVLIGGQTLHSLILSSPNGKSKDITALVSIWKGVKYLIVDEVSMIGCRFLSSLSNKMRQAKGDDPAGGNKPFGGVNVIFFGDFAQLKPPKQFALYSYQIVKNPSFSQSRDEDGVSAMHGAFLWRQITTVVQLVKNQRHSDDPIYAQFLDRLRVGKCLKKESGEGLDDLTYLKSRLLENLAPDPLLMSSFENAPIIVGSKAVRDLLNAKCISYHSHRLNSETYLYHSRDKIKRTVAPSGVARVLWDIPSSQNREAFGRLPMFIGMKVMITENIAFDNGVVNGAEGQIYDIKFEEEGGKRYPIVAYVLIDGCGICLPGLPKDVVPIFPVTTQIEFKWLEGTPLKAKRFTRRQLPLVPAYVYTDFKSQGRTLTKVIVDLATARGQGVYVMLSRVKSLNGLAILRWFPSTKVYHRLAAELRDEMKRIETLSSGIRQPATED